MHKMGSQCWGWLKKNVYLKVMFDWPEWQRIPQDQLAIPHLRRQWIYQLQDLLVNNYNHLINCCIQTMKWPYTLYGICNPKFILVTKPVQKKLKEKPYWIQQVSIFPVSSEGRFIKQLNESVTSSGQRERDYSKRNSFDQTKCWYLTFIQATIIFYNFVSDALFQFQECFCA